MKLSVRVLSAVAVLLTLACGGDDDGPLNPNGEDGTVTANVSGQANFVANGVVASYSSNTLVITSVQTNGSNSRSITLLVNNVTGNGTYSFTLAGNSASFVETTGSTSQSWLTAITQGSGSVTITTLSGLHIVADFSFTAPANTISGATGTRTVTGGHFDVTASNPTF